MTMTRGCGASAGKGASATAALVIALVLAGLGCRSRPFCARGQDETRVGDHAVWCRDAKAKSATYVEFHPGTRQFRQRCTFADGQLSGPFEAAHPGGQKWIEGSYVAGRLGGRWTQWDSAGNKVAEGEYRDGRLVSGAPIAVASVCENVPRVE